MNARMGTTNTLVICSTGAELHISALHSSALAPPPKRFSKDSATSSKAFSATELQARVTTPALVLYLEHVSPEVSHVVRVLASGTYKSPHESPAEDPVQI